MHFTRNHTCRRRRNYSEMHVGSLFACLMSSQDTGKGLVSLMQLEISKAFVSDQSYLILEFSPAYGLIVND